MDLYFVSLPPAVSDDFFASPFWVGDKISERPMLEFVQDLDSQVAHVLAKDPSARIVIRFNPDAPASWRDLHPEDCFVTEDGASLPDVSLASRRYLTDSAKFSRAVVSYCRKRVWAEEHLVGFWNGLVFEGTPLGPQAGWLFDHSPVMLERWRSFLKKRYRTLKRLRAAHRDDTLTFETIPLPRDQLRGAATSVDRLPFWPDAAANAPLRDYLELQGDLFRETVRRIASATRQASLPDTLLLMDMLKLPQQGWNVGAFFDASQPWPTHWPETLAASGNSGVSAILDGDLIDGLITPHDYLDRGLGGTFEPEGLADSCVLRGKRFFCEMDTRTWCGHDPIAPSRTVEEFAAVTWRNFATALTRGFDCYWMDVYEDWFADDALHPVIARQREVLAELAEAPQSPVPGIAVIIDDRAPFDTSGDGAFFHEAIRMELKTGLARCGVPYRIYLLEDLARADFPDHRVFYFPALFRADDRVRDLLKKKVQRSGHTVVWGPGSGLSSGDQVTAESAAALTGFTFDLDPVAFPRRVSITDFAHPITANLPADAAIYGGPLVYGPCLHPTDGTPLGEAWAKLGRNRTGLAVKEVGRDNRRHIAIFTSAVPLPASLWAGIARHAGAHVYADPGDILLASDGLVALHTVRPGPRTLRLPATSAVTDLLSGKLVSRSTDRIDVEFDAPGTRFFRLQPKRKPESKSASESVKK